MTVPPLTTDQVSQFERDGFIFPLRALSAEQVLLARRAIGEHLDRRFSSQLYELTDPIRVRVTDKPEVGETYEYETGGATEPTTFPFLFNLWKIDERFRRIGLESGLAQWARQLLHADEVLLMEDNVVVKNGNTGTLPWHQDFSYWPLAEPAAITIWIALDTIDSANGGMEVVPGSQQWGERLPVSFGDGVPFMADSRPTVEPVPADPRADGHPIVSYRLRPGECGLHNALTWHGSCPNTSNAPRYALILRYVVAGTIWLGEKRFPYDDIGCPAGSPLTTEHFPAAAGAR